LHEFCINEFIDAVIAADGDDDILLAAEVIFDEKDQEMIDEPFAIAKSMGFPTGWMAKKRAATATGGAKVDVWSRDGLRFNTKNEAFSFIGLKKRDPSLTDEMCNLFTINFRQAGRLAKTGATRRSVSWVCVNPEGKRDSLISPADASQSTMAASANMRARDVLRLKEILGDIEDPTIRSSLENIIASDGSKPAAMPSTSKPAAISSAVAVTVKKGKGKKRMLSTESCLVLLICPLSSTNWKSISHVLLRNRCRLEIRL